MSFQVATRDRGGVRILALAGEIDIRSARELQRLLLDCLDAGHRSLLLDFSRIELISGAGLRVLITIEERLEAAGGRLALCCLDPQVEKVFDIGRMTRRFSIHEDRQQAVSFLERSVRVARIARLAGSLLRQRDEGKPEKRRFSPTGPDRQRSSLGAELLAADDPPQAKKN